jgi:hypothetical protein
LVYRLSFDEPLERVELPAVDAADERAVRGRPDTRARGRSARRAMSAERGRAVLQREQRVLAAVRDRDGELVVELAFADGEMIATPSAAIISGMVLLWSATMITAPSSSASTWRASSSGGATSSGSSHSRVASGATVSLVRRSFEVNAAATRAAPTTCASTSARAAPAASR